MKTVLGKIVYAKPISLSRAANSLSNFVDSDNVDSQTASVYLRRASAAFNELLYIKSHRKHRQNGERVEEDSVKSDISPKNPDENVVTQIWKFEDNNPIEISEKGTEKREDQLRKKEKKRKKIDGSLVSEENDDNRVGAEEDTVNIEEVMKKKKKKSGKVDESVVARKKKKRRGIEADDELHNLW